MSFSCQLGCVSQEHIFFCKKTMNFTLPRKINYHLLTRGEEAYIFLRLVGGTIFPGKLSFTRFMLRVLQLPCSKFMGFPASNGICFGVVLLRPLVEMGKSSEIPFYFG